MNIKCNLLTLIQFIILWRRYNDDNLHVILLCNSNLSAMMSHRLFIFLAHVLALCGRVQNKQNYMPVIIVVISCKFGKR